MIDGAVSPHEGLTQTQETQEIQDTQEMEQVAVIEQAEMEEGEIHLHLEGRDTRVVDGG